MEKLSNEDVNKMANLIKHYAFLDADGEIIDTGWWAWQDIVAETVNPSPVYVSGVGYVEIVASSLASYDEAESASVHMIFKVIGENGVIRHFRKNGYHTSWDGTTWDGPFFEVFPRQKTITVYERG